MIPSQRLLMNNDKSITFYKVHCQKLCLLFETRKAERESRETFLEREISFLIHNALFWDWNKVCKIKYLQRLSMIKQKL